ncbi:FAD binding domain-containing protein [Candidatus Bipolaricaulota bacterium]
MLPAFGLERPSSLEQALKILAATPKAFLIAGGTNLIVDARSGKLTPDTVVDIGGLDELHGIEVTDTEIVIRSATTIAELLASSVIEQHAFVLFSACKTFANTLIRNRATIGGNLANNAPCADTAPALLVLDAEVELASVIGTRRVPLDEFLLEPFKTKRQANEILTAVRFPIPPETAIGRFQKMGLRNVSCMAKVDVGLLLDFDDAGVCSDARIALGAASPIARRARDAEAGLVGQALTAKAINASANSAAEATVPRPGSEYKQQVVIGLVRRLLVEIANEASDANA